MAFMLLIPIFVSLWTVTIYYYLYRGSLPVPLVQTSVYFTITLVFMRIFYNNTRIMSRSKFIIVEEDRVIKKSPRRMSYLHYSVIRDIRLSKIPLLKRWMTIVTVRNEKLVLPLRVHGGDEMVKNIFQNMYASGTFLENSGATMKRISAISRRLNALYKLREKNMPNLLRVVTAAALLYGAVSIIFWDRGLITAVPFGMCGMFLQAGAYFAAERFHLKALLRDNGDDSGGNADAVNAPADIDDLTNANTSGASNADTGGWSYKEYYIAFGLAALLAGMTIGILITRPI